MEHTHEDPHADPEWYFIVRSRLPGVANHLEFGYETFYGSVKQWIGVPHLRLPERRRQSTAEKAKYLRGFWKLAGSGYLRQHMSQLSKFFSLHSGNRKIDHARRQILTSPKNGKRGSKVCLPKNLQAKTKFLPKKEETTL